ncbi:MAG TPA: putative colanic acid biosynthesis acetyltransferase [Tepidisphaeraceae bacterium]|nr:putative colanic acid biosynthesis acetyltransferase [Tepidisphaeraceae bacterium]
MSGVATKSKETALYQDLSRFRLPANFRGRPGWMVQLWWLVQGSLFAWSPQFMYAWRRFLVRLFGMKIGKAVILRPSATVAYPWKVSIGDYAWIGDDVVLYSLGEIEIGANAVISQRSYICAASHNHTVPTFDIFDRKVTIGAEAWIATDVFVGPGVTIGAGTVVGARSSVFSDLPGGMLCVGSPARPTGPRIPGGTA